MKYFFRKIIWGLKSEFATSKLLKKYMQIMMDAQGVPRIDFDYCPELTDEEKRRLKSYEDEINSI